MVHCVTQQQPLPANSIGVAEPSQEINLGEVVQVLDLRGRRVKSPEKGMMYLWVYSSGRVIKRLME